MKIIRSQTAQTIWAAVFAAAFMAGCASQSTTTPDQAGGAQSGTPSGAQPSATPQTGGPGAAQKSLGDVRDPRGDYAKRSVYYEFDGYDVKAEYRPMVEAHAQYLKQNPSARITIEGNCDERGSREYNVALGQRRAESVMKMMTLLGVREGQIESVSFGKEKPRAAGNDEKAWSENRRSDFAYKK
jgi:peptidoglycan-associated lipoprotein